MPELWDGYEGAQPVPADPNLWPGDRAPVRFTVRPPSPPQLWEGLTGAVGRQTPPSFALPPEETPPGIVERNLPKVYDPLQQQQQEVFKHAFSLTPMGSITDAYDAIQQADPVGLTTAAAGMLPIPGARAAAKAAKAAKTGSEVVQGFAPYANPRLRAQAEALRGKYPQYAEQYPAVGPPELMWNLPDPNNPGKFLKQAGGTVPYKTLDEAIAKAKEPGFFLEKKLTPEAEQFQKDRNIIQRDMDLHGYDPYFDPAKRFDVDPKHYGPFEDTAVTASPKTQAKRDEWNAKYGTDEIRARLQEGFKRGSQVPESDRWYLMGQLEQAYVKQLGPKAGREAFEKEFADMMAATTGGAAPYDNNLMAHYANFINKRGERLPEAGWQLPFPIGGRFASGNLKQAQKYIDQGSVDWAENNAKRYDFSSAFKGNKNAGTIDEQMMTAYDPSLKDKQPVWYGPATKTMREEAAKAGVDARGFQDVDWAGLKALKTEAKGKEFEYEGPMINQINRKIETTHRLTGMPREEIVRRGEILKEIPMYGLAGALGTGAALAPGLFGGDEAQAGPLDVVRKGIKAYHGSPHDFDRFDINKIGLGEGNQMYGHGLYFADKEGTAKWYRDALSSPGLTLETDKLSIPTKPLLSKEQNELMAGQFLSRHRGDFSKAMSDALREKQSDAFDTLAHWKDAGAVPKLEQTGKMYEVNINADPSRLLSWDKPLGEQSDRIIDAIRPLLEPARERQAAARARMLAGEGKRRLTEADRATLSRPLPTLEETQGSAAYKHVGLPANTSAEGYPRSSALLREAGIPGIKYLDQNSRPSTTGIGKPDAAYAQKMVEFLNERLAKETSPTKKAEIQVNLKDWSQQLEEFRKHPEGTSNYVMFDDKLIDILRKFALPGAAGGGALAPQLFDREQPAPNMWGR